MKPNYQSNKPLRYLSLFSGIGGFEVGIESVFPKAVCVGYSEIDPHTLKVYQKHFPDHPYLGPVQNIKGPLSFDLLVGGSPCQNLSSTNINGVRGLQGSKSRLFFEYLRILKKYKPKYFILENVKSMRPEDKDIITKKLGVEPIALNSNLVSAQHRGRLYWTNIPLQTWILDLPSKIRSDRVKNILLPVSVLERKENVDLLVSKLSKPYHNYLKWKRRGAGIGFYPITDSDQDKSRILTTKSPYWINDKRLGKLRNIHPIEAERLQTFPDNWTQGLSYRQRIKALGNAVTCNVIGLILLNLSMQKLDPKR